MVEPFLIIVVIVMAVLVLFGVCLLVVIMGHPDDKNVAWFPRIITIFGLWLAFASILILPYDVANAKTAGGGVQVNILWQIVYITLAVLVGAIIPFAFFYYENDVDPDEQIESFFDTQIGMALKYTLVTLVIFVVIFIIMYSLLNKAYIPVLRIAQSPATVYNGDASVLTFPNLRTGCVNLLSGQAGSTSNICQAGLFYWIIPVSLPLYIIAFLAFVGWWFFTTFVGVGFFALPLDLINAYRTRPTPISTKAYFEQRTVLGQRCKALLELGEKMQSEFDKGGKGVWQKQQDKSTFRAFEKNYFYLKKDYQILYVAHKLKGGNPLVPIAELILGLISVVLSACWFIHIAIFILPARPYTPFLNDFFIKLEEGVPSFPLFGVLAFAIFSFYLLWCVVKGNFRLGVRFLFWKIYPMEVENTLMNAFLMNTLIILLCSIPAVQFCVTAFPIYARFTQADIMFGNQIRYLEFFRYFFDRNVFIILMLCISALTILFLFLFPNNKASAVEAQLDRLAKSTNTSLHDYADDLK